jgi:hypothetical protein
MNQREEAAMAKAYQLLKAHKRFWCAVYRLGEAILDPPLGIASPDALTMLAGAVQRGCGGMYVPYVGTAFRHQIPMWESAEKHSH